MAVLVSRANTQECHLLALRRLSLRQGTRTISDGEMVPTGDPARPLARADLLVSSSLAESTHSDQRNKGIAASVPPVRPATLASWREDR